MSPGLHVLALILVIRLVSLVPLCAAGSHPNNISAVLFRRWSILPVCSSLLLYIAPLFALALCFDPDPRCPTSPAPLPRSNPALLCRRPFASCMAYNLPLPSPPSPPRLVLSFLLVSTTPTTKGSKRNHNFHHLEEKGNHPPPPPPAKGQEQPPPPQKDKKQPTPPGKARATTTEPSKQGRATPTNGARSHHCHHHYQEK